ncbi:MAG: SusC/RagA family TonB-linked outer membrane protein [Bacteroidales bacterium]
MQKPIAGLRVFFTRSKYMIKLLVITLAIMSQMNAQCQNIGLNEKNVIISKSRSSNFVVKGQVLDIDGLAIIGATVLEKGTNNATITGVDGSFSLSVMNKAPIIKVTYIGYKTIEVKSAIDNFLNIKMLDDSKDIEEVVVVGYGTQKKVNLSGAVVSISSKDIAETHASSTSSLLAGRLPGVISTAANGIPGQGASIAIRGQSSWNNAPVLFVVDGIQVNKEAFDAINIDEIESISVLKDASAAVYGARAANGVVLVTTKRGDNTKPKLSFSTNFGISSPTSYPEFLNAYEYATLWNEVQTNKGFDINNPNDTEQFYSEELVNNAKNNSSDWYNETFKKKSLNQKYNLSINGGSERVKYFMSLGYLNDGGMYDGMDYNRLNLRANIDAKITENVSVRLDLQGTESNFNQPQVSSASLFEYAIRRSPMDQIYNSDGSYFDTGSRHPIAERDNSGYKKNRTNNYRTILGVDIKIPYVSGLKLNGLISYVRGANHSKSFITPYTQYSYAEDGSLLSERTFNKTTLSEDMYIGNNLTTSLTLTYNKKFKDHNVSGLFVYEQFDLLGASLGASRTNYPFTSIDQIFAGGDDNEQSNSGSPSQDARRGYIGRANYDYKSKYLAELSFRYDGSLKFHPSQRWGFFPSVSLAWRLSEEKFLAQFSNLDNLKIRSSYGILGNDAVGGWQWVTNYSFGGSYIFNQNPDKSIVSGGIPNEDLTWEKTATVNIGVDASFYNGLISVEADFFRKKTYDILGSRNSSMPGTFGATLPSENYGIVTAKGFELQINHKKMIGEVRYSIGGNISWARNNVVLKDYASGVEPWNVPVGKPMGYRVGFVSMGLFQTDEEAASWPLFKGTKPTAGDVKYADLNEDGILDDRDREIISRYGNVPELMFGLNFSASWREFDISGLFQGAANRNVMLSGFATQMFIGSGNMPKYLYDERWTPDNKNARFPKACEADHPSNNKNSTFWLFNGSYLRLKNIELGYTFPKSILSKLAIERLRLYIGGNNLFVIDGVPGFDPERQDGSTNYYPQQRVINIGVNLIF